VKDSFPPKNFTAAILLHIAILGLDIWISCRLIYYPVMTITGRAETLMGAVGV
jgi:hypothetical protein